MDTQIFSIKKIYKSSTSFTSDDLLILTSQSCILYSSDFTRLNTIGLSSLKIADKLENKQRIYSLELEFELLESFDDTDNMNTYLVQTVEGVFYLIGSGSRPYPVYSQSQDFPSTLTSKSINTVKVTYSSLNSALLIKNKVFL